jgi:hypothetical protein
MTNEVAEAVCTTSRPARSRSAAARRRRHTRPPELASDAKAWLRFSSFLRPLLTSWSRMHASSPATRTTPTPSCGHRPVPAATCPECLAGNGPSAPAPPRPVMRRSGSHCPCSGWRHASHRRTAAALPGSVRRSGSLESAVSHRMTTPTSQMSIPSSAASVCTVMFPSVVSLDRARQRSG